MKLTGGEKPGRRPVGPSDKLFANANGLCVKVDCGDVDNMAGTRRQASSRRLKETSIETIGARRAASRDDFARVDQLDVKGSMEIPHNPVHLKDGVLSSKRAGKDFVNNMTHEVHTPLNVIIGLCRLLRRDRQTPLSSGQKEAVDRMERNAHALLQTVDHLLTCLRSGRFR